jgi:NADH:quinone reductase (non-electrogenic)|tara:strand:- start:39453 stop:40430 length:978 start_codon:yes stop_codon:yes gene_type:complete
MFDTKITRLLNIKYPILGGAMMSISKAEFVAAISNAGALGILTSAIYQTAEEFSAAIDLIQATTDKPFAVNINLFPSMRPVDNEVYVGIMIEKGVKIVETSGHAAPEKLSKMFKQAGMIWLHKCVGVRYAKKAESLGADAITVVGYENGGATGKLDIGTLVLIPTVVDAVNIPVTGGGGIADGRGLVSVLAAGADAAIIGSRLMMTKECPIHNDLKHAFVKASELDTTLVMRSIGSTHRVWNNQAAKNCMEAEQNGASFEQLLPIIAGDNARRMFAEGDLTAGLVSLSQSVGLAHDIPSVKELLDRIMQQAQQSVQRLNGQLLSH